MLVPVFEMEPAGTKASWEESGTYKFLPPFTELRDSIPVSGCLVRPYGKGDDLVPIVPLYAKDKYYRLAGS